MREIACLVLSFLNTDKVGVLVSFLVENLNGIVARREEVGEVTGQLCSHFQRQVGVII